MKYLLILSVICIGTILTAQAPARFRYQAVAREAGGNVITGKIDIRFSLLEDDSTGVIRYKETQTTSTNPQGVFAVAVGNGSVVFGNIETVDWAHHQYWLQVEIKTPGASAYTTLGASQLLAVPYAMYAAHAGEELTAGDGIHIQNGVISNTGDLDPNNELQTLTVNGDQLNISNGNTVTLPTGTTYMEGTGIDINGNTISAMDASPTNEIQTLSLNGQQLSLSNGGGSVQLPVGNTAWTTNGTNTYSNPITNNVAIGSTSSSAKLGVVSSGSGQAGDFISPGAGDALHTYCNGTGSGLLAGSLNGTGGSFTSQTGTAGFFSSNSGPGIIVEKGGVGIGLTNPSCALDIHDGAIKVDGKNQSGSLSSISLYSHKGNYALYSEAQDDGTSAVLIANSGKCLYLNNVTSDGMGTGIRLSCISTVWDIYGDGAKDLNFAHSGTLRAWIYDTDGSYHQSSDRRLKKDILPFSDVLSGISKLQAYTYHMKDAPEDAPLSVGFMAQDVEKQFPAMVAEKDGYKSLCYDQFAVLAVQAVKEQQKQIEDQQKLISSQQQQLDAQAATIKTMQEDLAALKALSQPTADRK